MSRPDPDLLLSDALAGLAGPGVVASAHRRLGHLLVALVLVLVNWLDTDCFMGETSRPLALMDDDWPQALEANNHAGGQKTASPIGRDDLRPVDSDFLVRVGYDHAQLLGMIPPLGDTSTPSEGIGGNVVLLRRRGLSR